MKYKVLLVNKYHYLKGGSETYHFALADLLKSKGHDVVYFAMEDEKNIPCEYSGYFSKHVELGDDQSVVDKIKTVFHTLYSFDAKRKIDKLIRDEKPDVVHINLMHKHLTLSILDGIKKYNIPVVFTAHDSNCICPNHLMFAGGKVCDVCITQHNYKEAFRQKCVKDSLLKTILAVAEAKYNNCRKAYDKVDCYICPSEFMKRKYQQAEFTKSPIEHWTNFLPSDTEYKVSEVVKDYFLFFGRLSEEKGIITLLKGYEKGKFSNPLYIVGDGPQRSLLEEYVSKQGLTEKVIFTGFQSGDKLKKYVAEAKCIILPSELHENCPYSVLEAMAVGKPVIVSNYGGLPELVNEGENGYICRAFSPDSIRECLDKINNLNEDEYMKMCVSAMEKAKAECDSDKYYEKLMNCYGKLISKSKAE